MQKSKRVRKFKFEGDVVCIAEELLDYIDSKVSLDYIIKDKNMQIGYDFEIIPSYLLNNKLAIQKYNDRNYITLLKSSGMLKILNGRRQTEALDIARAFDLKLNFIKEREYLNVIKAAFSDYTCIQQYYVSKEDSRGYFIDLYIYGKDKNIAVEVDENGHASYDNQFEKERENYIKSVLGCEFVRFNPDDKNFNIGNVISKIMKIKNTPIKTHYNYIDSDTFHIDVIDDTLDEIKDDSSKLIQFIERIQIENIHHDLGFKLNFKKSILNDDDFIITIDDTPLLNSKDIVLEEIVEEDDIKKLIVVVSYSSDIVHKDLYIEFAIYNDILSIKLLKGFKKNLYIKEYMDSLNKYIIS